MADDKGDDLFEDLDRFFAPIKDVDWDEPDEPSAPAPRDEPVAVRAERGEAASAEVTATATAADEDEDDAWFDAGPIGGDPDDGDDEEPDVRIIEEPEGVAEGQTGLFEGGREVADEAFWLDEEGAESAAEVTTETSVAEPEVEESLPAGAQGSVEEAVVEEAVVVEELLVSSDEEPSEEEIEAAAEHFADSVREERYDTAPIGEEGELVGAASESGGDLLTELGADDVEEHLLADLEEEEVPATVVVGTDGISGPSWQEPSSVEVGADLERRGTGAGERDVPAAFLTGVALALAALIALWAGPAWFAVLAGILVLVAQGELFGVMVRQHHQPATAVGLVTGALVMAGAYYGGEAAITAMFALGVMATFLWYLTVPPMQRKDILASAGLTILNVAWIPVLGAYLIALLEVPDGTALVISIIGLTFVFDATAFLVGSVMGGAWFPRPLAPATSPKKSWEGAIIATLFTVIVSVALVSSFVEPFNGDRVGTLLLGLVVALAATLGDLAESLVKRDLGIKDMGSILPGHGGVLDRIDSLLFVAPATYLLLRVLLGA